MSNNLYKLINAEFIDARGNAYRLVVETEKGEPIEVYFPKSQIELCDDGSIYCTKWFIDNVKEEEIQESILKCEV